MDFELTEERRMLKDTVARFVEEEITPQAAEWDEQEAFPSEVFRSMADLGLFGISWLRSAPPRPPSTWHTDTLRRGSSSGRSPVRSSA